MAVKSEVKEEKKEKKPPVVDDKDETSSEEEGSTDDEEEENKHVKRRRTSSEHDHESHRNSESDIKVDIDSMTPEEKAKYLNEEAKREKMRGFKIPKTAKNEPVKKVEPSKYCGVSVKM